MYTKLSLEICGPEKEKRESIIIRNGWDLNISDMVEMFSSLLLAEGYSQSVVEEYLGEL